MENTEAIDTQLSVFSVLFSVCFRVPTILDYRGTRFTAIISTSSRAPRASAATATVLRAG